METDPEIAIRLGILFSRSRTYCFWLTLSQPVAVILVATPHKFIPVHRDLVTKTAKKKVTKSTSHLRQGQTAGCYYSSTNLKHMRPVTLFSESAAFRFGIDLAAKIPNSCFKIIL